MTYRDKKKKQRDSNKNRERDGKGSKVSTEIGCYVDNVTLE